MTEEQFHQAARDFMDANTQDGWKEMSLDEWLIEYGEMLPAEVRSEGWALMDKWFAL